MGNIVTCIKRVYQIQMPNGIKMEVESEKPLSGVTTAKLLEDDNDISSFLENVKILDVKVPHDRPATIKKSSYKKKPNKKLKKEKRALLKKIERGRLDIVPKEQEINSEDKTQEKLEGGLIPCDRINMMTTMEGEFTRLDYQKFIEDKGHKMSDFMGHGDIEDALLLKRIAPTGEKIGKGRRKYRIIDVMPVEQYMFRKILKNHREKRKY